MINSLIQKRLPQQLLILLILTAVFSVLSYWLHPRMPGYQEGKTDSGAITLVQIRTQDIQPLWVDARDWSAFQVAHIPGAIHLNEDRWEEGLMEFMDLWHPDSVVVVYCEAEGCQASKAVAMRLSREMNIENVYHLDGGWDVWIENPAY
jgi:rhodanese-related sulfurtransferase